MRLRKFQTGVTLIEVMITVTLLSIGLLGLAALQTSSIRYTVSAHYHAIAAQQARDMADRMRANIRAIIAGAYDNAAGIPAPIKDCNNAAETCAPAELQVFDLFEWNTTNASVLPQGGGSISVDATGTIYTIAVNWDDRGEAKSYSLRFQP